MLQRVIRSVVRTAAGADRNITSLLSEAKKTWHEARHWGCPVCKEENTLSSAFCSKCGAPAPTEEEVKLPQCPSCGKLGIKTPFCTKCGHNMKPATIICGSCSAEVKAGNAFCSSCGASLGAARPKGKKRK